MPDKALGPLMAVLPIAPSDVRLNQRLAALYTRSERFADAAACCQTLATVYSQAGLTEEAARYEDLANRCEEHAAASPKPPQALSATDAAEIPIAPWPLTRAAGAQEFAVEDAGPASSPDSHAQEPVEFETVPEASGSTEIDLSDEWQGSITAETPEVASEQSAEEVAAEPSVEEISVESSDAVAETIEEIRFYLEHSMVDQARAAYAKLQSQTADYEQLALMQAEINAASAPAEIESVEEPPVVVEEESPAAEAVVEPESQPEPASPLNKMVAELDSSLGEEFLPKTVSHEIEHEQPITAQAGTDSSLVSHLEFMSGPKFSKPEPAESPAPDSGVLGEFVADLENALGDGFLQEAPVATTEHPQADLHMAASAVSGASVIPTVAPVPPVAAPPAAAASATVQPSAPPSTFRASVRPANGPAASTKHDMAASVDLADMFGEIRHELEEDVASAEEDPETHYNLGVAFREMGLLDEAIGELQKVCQSIDHGHPFAQVMQTYTWLAQCFLDKGVPEAAIRWYEKALKLPSLDEETRTALHYELASSYETAEDKNSALHHFMEVYGSNIDYRDVGERIRALKS
jgi:hypothetical protein